MPITMLVRESFKGTRPSFQAEAGEFQRSPGERERDTRYSEILTAGCHQPSRAEWLSVGP